MPTIDIGAFTLTIALLGIVVLVAGIALYWWVFSKMRDVT